MVRLAIFEILGIKGGISEITLNDCVKSDAAKYFELPDWLATKVHLPKVTKVTVVPFTVQTDVVVVLNDALKPELVPKVTVTGVPKTQVLGADIVITCVLRLELVL